MKIAVIGSGIVGATASFYLTKHKHQVTLFDEGTGQATKAAAGIISPWLSQRRNQNWYQLAQQGAKFYPQLVADLGLGADSDIYRQVGTILFKKNDQLLERLFDLAHTRREAAPEIGEIALLSQAEITELIPILKPESRGLFISGGAKVDGQSLIQSLVTAFEAQGGIFKQGRVSNLSSKGKIWQVSTATETETFDKVILATGAWLPQLLTPLGYEVDVRPQKGQLVEVALPYETTNWPVVMPQGESDIIPFNDGRILIGATHENEEEYDLTPNPEILANLLASIAPLSAELSQGTIKNYRVGTRAYTSDFLPFFGEVKEQTGLFVASGLGSSGLTTGPIIARTIVAWLEGETTALKAENYSPTTYLQKI